MTAQAGDGLDPVVLVVGSGAQRYREYLLSSMASQHPLWLLSDEEPTWQVAWVIGTTVVDVLDPRALVRAAHEVASSRPVRGVVCYDEALIRSAADVVAELGLPGMTPEATANCRDKQLTRAVLTQAGIPQPRSIAVHSLNDAAQVAAEIGYPVVLKPRNLGASEGVIKVERVSELADGFRVTWSSGQPDLPASEWGVLVEEFLDGPEISIDGAVFDGRYTVLVVAHKRVGLTPYFEEIEHLVEADDPLFDDEPLRAMLEDAHRALGVTHGITHTERIVEEGLMTGYDVVIVGGGVVGAATAAALSLSGLSAAVAHAGSALPSATEASGGLVRAFESDGQARRLAVRSYELLWGHAGDRRDTCGFRQTGSLVCLSPEELVELPAALAELAGEGIDTEVLTGAEVSLRWPALAGAGIAAALWEPGGGYADPPATAATLLKEARAGGVVEYSDRLVQGLLRSGDRVVGVRTDEGDVLAPAVVVAAGCGSAALLPPQIAGGLVTKRIRYALVAHPDRPLPTLVDSVTGMWGRPHGDDQLLVGRPRAEWNVQPCSGHHITDEQLEYIRAGGISRWPALAGAALVGARVGTDLYGPGGPLLGAVSACPGLVVATGWSGHGFKTAPAAGEVAAKAAAAIVAASVQ